MFDNGISKQGSSFVIYQGVDNRCYISELKNNKRVNNVLLTRTSLPQKGMGHKIKIDRSGMTRAQFANIVVFLNENGRNVIIRKKK